jgi:hypothetical protein
MKMLRFALAFVLAIAVPGTAMAALLGDGHCAGHAASAATHATHGGHASHAAGHAGAAHATMHSASHCDCGCACAGSHCAGSAGAALAMDAAAPARAEVPATEFVLVAVDPALAHSRDLLRPPSTI